MSESVDPWQPPAAKSRQVAVFVTGRPASPARFVLIPWAVLSLQLIVILTSALWIEPLPLRLLLAVIVGVAPLRWSGWLGRLRPPSAQLRWLPGGGARLSGNFAERYIPLMKPLILNAIDLRNDRLAFDVQAITPAGSTETLSLDCKAFRSVSAGDLHALFAAAMTGDGAAVASVAKARNLKLRERTPGLTVPVMEAKWMHALSLAGSFCILAIAFPFRHLVLP